MGTVIAISGDTIAVSARFGWAVAIADDVIVVGAPFNSEAYIFEPDRTGGYDETRLEEPGFFGGSVAVSGGTVVVGASLSNVAGTDAGAVFVYRPDGSGGCTKTRLTASEAANADRFGASVAVAGDRVLVRAFQADLDPMGAPYPAGVNFGAAYVYDHDGAEGYTETKLTSFDAAATDRYGFAVALSAETLVVTAPQDDTGGSNAGSVYVYSTVVPGGADGGFGGGG